MTESATTNWNHYSSSNFIYGAHVPFAINYFFIFSWILPIIIWRTGSRWMWLESISCLLTNFEFIRLIVDLIDKFNKKKQFEIKSAELASRIDFWFFETRNSKFPFPFHVSACNKYSHVYLVQRDKIRKKVFRTGPGCLGLAQSKWRNHRNDKANSWKRQRIHCLARFYFIFLVKIKFNLFENIFILLRRSVDCIQISKTGLIRQMRNKIRFHLSRNAVRQNYKWWKLIRARTTNELRTTK